MRYHDDLEFLQSLEERELSELVLMPLFEKLGYQEIRYVHGVLEHGKDIVFSQRDPLDQDVRYCATVKRYQLSGSVSSSRSARELLYQIEQALGEPYVDPFTGHEVRIAKVYVVTPFPASNSCIHSIRSELRKPENRVAFIDGPKLHSLIRGHLPDLLATLPNPELRYMDALVRRLAESGSQLARSNNRSLLDVYVSGRLTPTTPEDARLISFARPLVNEKSHPGLDFYSLARQRSVILADVGAGKTTFLQRTAIHLASKGTQPGEKQRVLPLLIPLHLLPVSVYQNEDSFMEAALQYLHERHGYSPVGGLSNKNYTLLLDGFDEIPSSHSAAASVIQRLARHPFEGVVVTSRPSRIPLLAEPFSYFKLEPFSGQDIDEFLIRWFVDDPALQISVQEKVRSDPDLSIFCHSPLLLTLYAVLAQRHPVARLPVRRTEIYDLVVDYLLGSWDEARSIKNNFEKAPKEFVLEKVAFEAQRAGERTFSWDKLRKAAGELFETGRIDGTIDDLIGEIIYRSSLLRPNSMSLEFPHLSFQEYFAAKRLARISDGRLLGHVLLDEWWRGTLIFYFGLKRSMDEVRISNQKKFRGQGLALMELLSEAEFTSDQLRGAIFRIVGSDLLVNKELSDVQLEVCSRLGIRVLDALKDTLRLSGRGIEATNFFRLGFAMRTERSLRVVYDSQELLKQVPPKELFPVLDQVLPMARERRWTDFWESVVAAIEQAIDNDDCSRRILKSIAPDVAEILRRIKAEAGGSLRASQASRLERRLKAIEAAISETRPVAQSAEHTGAADDKHAVPARFRR